MGQSIDQTLESGAVMFCAPRFGVPRHVRLRGRVSILRSATRFAPARSQGKMVEDGSPSSVPYNATAELCFPSDKLSNCAS